jgi:hypothetical protein
MGFALLLVNASVISGFFPLLAALYNYRKLDPVLKLVAAFCLVSVMLDLIGLAILYLKLMHNTAFLIHFFDLIAVAFFTLIYFRAFYLPVLKKITLILGSISLLIIIINALFIEGIWVYPSVSNTVLSLFLIPLSLTYFYQLLTRQEFVHIEKQGLFWINAGVLFYFSILIFLFMLYNKISIAEKHNYYMMQSVTNIIANLLYSVGLLCKPQKATSSRY